MAYAQTTVTSGGTLVIGGIYDLQYPANQYDIVSIEIQRSANGSSSWSTVASQLFFPPTTSNNFLAINATNQIIQYYYRTVVSLQYQGILYIFTSSVVQMPKQLQSAPSAPTLSSRTTSSITLNSISNGEYRRNFGSAQSSTIFSGLLSGTSYSFQQRYAETSTLQASNWSSSASFSTNSAPQPPPTPTGLTAGNPPRFDNGLNIIWNTSSGATLYRIRIKLGVGGTYGYYTTSNTNFTFFDLGYSNTFFIGVRAENAQGVSSYTSDVQFTTAPKTPTASFVSSTTNSIAVNTNVSAGSWSFVRVWYRLIGSSWNFITLTNPTTSGTISGLLADTQYEIKASSYYTVSGTEVDNETDLESRDISGNIGYSSSLFITTGGARPNNWVWSYTIASGSNVYFVSGKAIFIMAATEWNNFTSRINEFRTYKSLSTASFTTVSTNMDVTKEIINQALNAIRAMSAHFTGGNTLISNRVAGQNILEANIYINMRDCLNSIT